MLFNHKNKISITLNRNISKHIKQGHPWVFSDVIIEKFPDKNGSYAKLKDTKGKILAHGFYSSKSHLSFRVITRDDHLITDSLIIKKLETALKNRLHLFSKTNQAIRLVNGEGDELPGIICDLYDETLVLKLDGEASEIFWNKEEIARFFSTQNFFKISQIYYKSKNKEKEKSELLFGENKNLHKIKFYENNILFEANIIDGAKTGFFIDQRDNRNFIKHLSHNKSVLNLFGYTGGFSVYAGIGQAKNVTTVDIAKEAINASIKNWELNLKSNNHIAICDDAFLFVKKNIELKNLWDLVITDPPSFAPNQKAVESATNAYIEIFKDSLKLVRHEGFFAASSCSGHISFDLFLNICEKALSLCHKRGKILRISGQPEDHPFLMALPQMRYLKFVFIQVFND